jgi:hypothetical protein
MTINNAKIVKRWNSVVCDIGCEYISINTNLSELEHHKKYYDSIDGISISWMIKEAKYWLSCYYEEGNVRCDDRFYDKECYKIWVSETGKLKRLIAKLECMEDEYVVNW